MEIILFDYPFPRDLVAQHPLPQRDDSRMMVIDRKSGTWNHRRFPDLQKYLREGDLLVLNNAEADLVPVEGRLVPSLPPYIKRKRATDFTEEDYQRYRTVYASVPGSRAAPTAGFHFTQVMLDRIRERGIETRFLTLHVSYDTYKPIRTPQIEDHPMHGEEYIIPPETIEAVTKAKKEKRRVIAVGTTVVRALEAFRLAPAKPVTSLYIYPGFQFQIVDAILTNFHRPRSTVLVMVSAFASLKRGYGGHSPLGTSDGGRELVLKAYEEAIREKYRLFSYGDCMLIL